MIRLEYFNGNEWILVDTWEIESFAWASLGSDNYNYRTVNQYGAVIHCNITQTPTE